MHIYIYMHIYMYFTTPAQQQNVHTHTMWTIHAANNTLPLMGRDEEYTHSGGALVLDLGVSVV